jgi:hypothetical protein
MPDLGIVLTLVIITGGIIAHLREARRRFILIGVAGLGALSIFCNCRDAELGGS